MANLFMRFPGGKSKALTLSYDDGVEQDARLIDILDKYQIKCTFNINTGYFAQRSRYYTHNAVICSFHLHHRQIFIHNSPPKISVILRG